MFIFLNKANDKLSKKSLINTLLVLYLFMYDTISLNFIIVRLYNMNKNKCFFNYLFLYNKQRKLKIRKQILIVYNSFRRLSIVSPNNNRRKEQQF